MVVEFLRRLASFQTPESRASALQTHPALLVNSIANDRTFVAHPALRRSKLSLTYRWRITRSFDSPPTGILQVEFLKTDLCTDLAVNFLEPNIDNTKPCKDVVSVRQFSPNNRILISCI
jgi:hypothetical protein